MTPELLVLILTALFFFGCVAGINKPKLMTIFALIFIIVLLFNSNILFEKECLNCNKIQSSTNEYCELCGEKFVIKKEEKE